MFDTTISNDSPGTGIDGFPLLQGMAATSPGIPEAVTLVAMQMPSERASGTRSISLDRPLDLRATLVVSGLKGPALKTRPDGLWRATRTPNGPVTVRMRLRERRLVVDAWGKGSSWALHRFPEWVGEHDDPSALVPRHPAVDRATRMGRGMRMAAVGGLVEVLVPTILAQKVTGREAGRSYRQLVARYGEPAPGPGGLSLPPHPDRLAGLRYFDFHPLGVERRRAETIITACRVAHRIEATLHEDLADSYRFLHRLPGIGPWTSASVMRVARGDPDAVPVGDFHLPNTVTWALASEPRGTDERMLELLVPYHGQRGRVIRLLERYAGGAPAYGPRTASPDFRRC